MKKRWNRFSATERRALILPDEVYGGGPFVELRGRGEVCIQGCRKILTCETDLVRLELRGSVLAVRGRQLTCVTYFAGAVAIRGVVCMIAFEEGSALEG